MKPWRVPYPKFGAGPGLERVSAIAARLEIELPAFGDKSAVIVGSNGKGSTAAMTGALLQHTSRQHPPAHVGVFTSPHLFDLNERFCSDGKAISDADLARHWDRVGAAIEAYERDTGDQAGGFEFLFLIAADWFKASGSAYTVWEAGIGGRLDPVRLIAARTVGLTSLDLEHTELLGDTLEAIARDKIAAAPRGAKLFAPDDIPVRSAIERACADNDVALSFVAPFAGALPLAGAFQHRNAALAVALARELAPLNQASIERGLAAVRWPGRLEIINEDPRIVIDVGHTPRGVAAALAGFQTMRRAPSAMLVCGASRDKDAALMIALLAGGFSTIICTSARHKGAPAQKIAAYARTANPAAEIVVAASVEEAHHLALARARAAGGDVYVAGGLFLAAEFKAVHVGRDLAALAFF
jgi:dihydrofolate synthase/folylpolyglutamate synthase